MFGMMPKVSVIIPVYNMEKYLGNALDSVLGQTLKEIEVIVVNDGSVDTSGAIIEKYQKNDKRIVYENFSHNRGVSAARNCALEAATGEFVAFLDPDDLYATDDVLEKLYSLAQKYQTEAAAGNMAVFRKDNFNELTRYGEELWNFSREEVIDYKDYPYTGGYTRFIFKLDVIRKNALKFGNYVVREDPVFFEEFMLKCGRFAVMEDVVYAYRIQYKTRFPGEKLKYEMIQAYKRQFNLFQERGMVRHLEVLCRDLCSDLRAVYFKGKCSAKIQKEIIRDADMMLSFCSQSYRRLKWSNFVVVFLGKAGIRWAKHKDYLRVKLWGISIKIKR